MWLLHPSNAAFHQHQHGAERIHSLQHSSAVSTDIALCLTWLCHLPPQIHHPKMETIWPSLSQQEVEEVEEKPFSFCLSLLRQKPLPRISPLPNCWCSHPVYWGRRWMWGARHGASRDRLAEAASSGPMVAVRSLPMEHRRLLYPKQPQTVRWCRFSFIIDLIHI